MIPKSFKPISEIALQGSVSGQLISLIAENHLRKFPGFEGTHISGYVPIYGAAREVWYVEAKVSSEASVDHGWIMLSTTERDFPIAHFATHGPTHWERLKERVSTDFFMVRFGADYMTAEDKNGQLLAELGERPGIIPDWAKVKCCSEGAVEDDKVLVSKSDERPQKPAPPETVPDTGGFYENLKRHHDQFLPPHQERVQRRWAKARATDANTSVQAATSSPSSSSYNIYWAQDFDPAKTTNNHAYYLQLQPNQSPNTEDWYTGCGGTAWLNLLGWFDLHGAPSLLTSQTKYNDSYINNQTVALRDYLGTYEAWWVTGEPNPGYTEPWDMDLGYQYTYNKLLHTYSGFFYDGWYDPIEDHTYEQVHKALVEKKLPCIIGYYEDWHYAIVFGVAEAISGGWQEDAYLYIYPAWTTTDTPNDTYGNQWIPKETIFGMWAIYDLKPVRDAGFEKQTSSTVSLPWQKGGPGNVGIDYNKKLAHSGANNAYIIVTPSTPQNQGSSIFQTLRLAPNNNYVLSVWLQTSNITDGYFSVRANNGSGPILAGTTFGSLPNYTNLSLPLKTGSYSTFVLYVGATAKGVNGWVRIDDVKATLA